MKLLANDKPRVALVVSAALFISSVPLFMADPLFSARLKALFGRKTPVPHSKVTDPREFEQNDAPIGSAFPTVGVAGEIRKRLSASKSGFLIVGLGDCESCVVFNMRSWEQSAKEEKVPLAGFALADVHDIDKFRRNIGSHAAIVSDINNELHRELNCKWAGRVYYFDEDWHLKWQMPFLGQQTMRASTDLMNILHKVKTR